MDQTSTAGAQTGTGRAIGSRLRGRCRFGLAVSALGLVSLAVVLPTASAKTFPPYGARGDASFSDTCPAGQYLVGLRARSGAWIDQIAISCRSLTGNVGGPYYGPARGTPAPPTTPATFGSYFAFWDNELVIVATYDKQTNNTQQNALDDALVKAAGKLWD